MDDWWLIFADWRLMIDDCWLMSDEWGLMIDDKINTNIIWNGWATYCLPQGGPPRGNLYFTFHIIFVLILSSIINHHSSLINHQSSIISYQSSVINPWSMIHHQSSITSHHFFLAFCDHFLKYIKTHIFKNRKKERKKLSPEAREKKESSSKSLHDINKSILSFRSNRTETGLVQ